MELEFTVFGKPETAGSKRGFIVRSKSGKQHVSIVDDNENTKPWQAQVRYAAKQAWPSPTLALGPVFVKVLCFFARPKCHYSTSKKTPNKLKPSAPKDHTQRPDSLKLMRAIEDALTGVLYKDDCQIVDEAHGKRWAGPGEPARAEIVVIAAQAAGGET